MSEFKLDIETRVRVTRLNPKLDDENRGPYEGQQFVLQAKESVHYVGTEADVRTKFANAMLPIARDWALDSNEPPEIKTGSAGTITATGAQIGASVHDHGVSTVTTVEWGETTALTETPVASDTSPTTADAWAGHNFDMDTLLTAETKYYYRVKLVSAGGTIYGKMKTFTTIA